MRFSEIKAKLLRSPSNFGQFLPCLYMVCFTWARKNKVRIEEDDQFGQTWANECVSATSNKNTSVLDTSFVDPLPTLEPTWCLT